MISSPGLRVPEPLTQLIPTERREVRQPFETLDQVPHLITVTLTTAQIETKEHTVDDLKDVIFSRLGQQRTAFWMALPSTGDSRVWEVPHTCTLEDLVLSYVNSRRIRLFGTQHAMGKVLQLMTREVVEGPLCSETT